MIQDVGVMFRTFKDYLKVPKNHIETLKRPPKGRVAGRYYAKRASAPERVRRDVLHGVGGAPDLGRAKGFGRFSYTYNPLDKKKFDFASRVRGNIGYVIAQLNPNSFATNVGLFPTLKLNNAICCKLSCLTPVSLRAARSMWATTPNDHTSQRKS